MTYVGSYFGMGVGNILSIIIFFIFGSFLGLSYKMFSSSIIFIFIYLGSLFSQGNGKIYTCLLFLLLGLYLSKKINTKIDIGLNGLKLEVLRMDFTNLPLYIFLTNDFIHLFFQFRNS